MANLSTDDILKLAKLSRLQLSDEEVAQFKDEISAVLNYVEQLQSVNLSKEKPTDQVTGLKNVVRKDQVINYKTDQEGLLMNAPSLDKKYLKVKRVIE